MGYVLTTLILAAVLLFGVYRTYRGRVPSWKALLGMGLTVIEDNQGSVIEYLRFDKKVAPWEIFFLRRDLESILEFGPETRFRYFKDGRVLVMTPELAAEIRRYDETRYLAYQRTEGRPLRDKSFRTMHPPYDHRETSFIPPSSLHVQKTGLQHAR